MSKITIHALRQRLGESQAQFGARFKVSQITVGYWESGRSKPARQRSEEIAALASSILPKKPSATPFRSIQYLGSKQRLAETIAEVVNEVAPGKSRVGDLFAGSGVVSAVLGTSRPTTAVDIQAYSAALVEVVLLGQVEDFSSLRNGELHSQYAEIQNQMEMLLAPILDFERAAIEKAAKGDTEELTQLIEFGSIAVHAQRPLPETPRKLATLLNTASNALRKSGLPPAKLIAIGYFGGPYFSYKQAIALDAIYAATSSLSPNTSRAALAVLLSTASAIANTVGKQFAQPMKLKKADGHIPSLLLQRALRDRNLDAIEVFRDWASRWQIHVLGGQHEHRVTRENVIDFVKSDQECQVYYADPPYTIDHYSRFYHVLETLALRDSPRLDEMKKGGRLTVLRGVYRAGRYQSPFCIPSKALEAFDQLISATWQHTAPLVMSYSPFSEAGGERPRLLTLDELIAKAKQYYPRVSVMEIDEHSHKKLNAKSLNAGTRNDAERLIICEVS